MPSPFSTKDAISVLVSNLRHSPVETAQEFAKCLTPAERGAIIYALRTKSNQEVKYKREREREGERERKKGRKS